MSTADIITVISAGSAAAVAIIGAVFAGLHSLRASNSAADAKTAARIALNQNRPPAGG